MPHELTLKNIDLLRPRGAAAPARHLGRRGLGEPLVAGAPARRAQPAPRAAASRRDGGGMTREQDDRRSGRTASAMRVLVAGQRARRSCSSTARGASTWGPFLDELAEQLHRLRARAPGHDAGRRRTHLRSSTACGTWSSATTSCCEALGLDGAGAGRPLLRRDGGVRGGGAASGARRRLALHRSASASGATTRRSSTGWCWSRPRCAAHVLPRARRRRGAARCSSGAGDDPEAAARARTRLTWALGPPASSSGRSPTRV